MEALGVLDHLPATARLSINVPYELVTVGTDWEAYRLALAHWILKVAPDASGWAATTSSYQTLP
jgi:hypothetical protein